MTENALKTVLVYEAFLVMPLQQFNPSEFLVG